MVKLIDIEGGLREAVARKCQALKTGIAYRQKMVASSSTEKTREKWEKQVKSWEKQLYDLTDGALLEHIKLVERPLLSDRDCQRVDIIVLKYKVPAEETRCMEHLIKYTDWPHKVTWYDNRDQTANFSKIWNRLVRESTCDFVLIMDSDAYVSENWLSRMMECFTPGYKCRGVSLTIDNFLSGGKEIVKAAPVGIVVPVTNKGGANTIQSYDFDGKSSFLTDAQVSGYFFLFRKVMIEEIGYFDERFYLHGQDSEWMDRVIESDWNIVIRTDVSVKHDVSVSVRKATKEKEFNYEMDIAYTKMIYDTIREEKQRGIYEPPGY